MRQSDIPRYHLHHVQTTGMPDGTDVHTVTDMISFNDVLRLRSKINTQYRVKTPTIHTGFGPRDELGCVRRFRFAWEHRFDLLGARVTDTMWVTRVDADS